MQIQALQTVQKLGWVPAYDWWNDHQTDHASGFTACARWVETVPVMPATVLGLELLLQDRALDLQMASDIILRDVGATLHMMRLITKEGQAANGRPFRMTHCLATLDAATWFPVLSANAVPFHKTSDQIASMWKHCRGVAHFAKLIAESLGEVSAEDAYLAGLLHEVENISSVLPKRNTIPTTDVIQLHQILAPSVMTALQSAKRRESGSVWRYVIASAHAMASSSWPVHAAAAKPFVA